MKIVSDFEHCPLRLEIVEDFSIHLNGKLVVFSENRTKTVVQNSSLLEGGLKSLLKGVFLFENTS